MSSSKFSHNVVDAPLEGADALQLYVSRLVVNVRALSKQGALLEEAIADRDNLLRELNPDVQQQ